MKEGRRWDLDRENLLDFDCGYVGFTKVSTRGSEVMAKVQQNESRLEDGWLA